MPKKNFGYLTVLFSIEVDNKRRTIRNTQVSLILRGIQKINKFREDVYLKMILGLSHSIAQKLAFVLSSKLLFSGIIGERNIFPNI